MTDKPTTEKYEVRNRWTNAVQFTAEISVTPDMLPSVKLGLAVRWGKNNGADLRYANLSGANLSGADMNCANLSGADMSGANLRSFKADMWMTLHQAQGEVPALVAALREGRVDGSQYEGECACLVGTLASAAHKHYSDFLPDHSSSHPAEQWFMMIRKGDKPGDDTGGGFAAAKALEWAL